MTRSFKFVGKNIFGQGGKICIDYSKSVVSEPGTFNKIEKCLKKYKK